MNGTVGQNVYRIEGPEKVTGKAIFTGDIKLPGMLYGKVLRSPLAHARIVRVDSHEAESLSGVSAVLTGDKLPSDFPYLGGEIKDQAIVAVGKVRYAGDIVAAVAATEERITEEALGRIKVDYEELPAVFTIEEALTNDAPLVHEKLQRSRLPKYGKGASYLVHENTNVCHHFRYQRGDIEEGFRAADSIFEHTFHCSSTHHYPLEPSISIASFESDSLTVWSPTQAPFLLRQQISQVFGLPLSRIRVIVPHVGGSFGGGKGGFTAFIAITLARMTGRPVRVAFTTEEYFKTICQPEAKITLKTGIGRDGTFVARRCEVYLKAGAYINTTATVTERAGYRAHGPYRIAHVLTDAYTVYTNTVPATAFRGFGGPQVAFAYESHLDMIAHAMGVDSLELRLKNLLERGEEYAPGDTPMDCDLKSAVKKISAVIKWGEGGESAARHGIKRGKGIACAVKDGGGKSKAANAMVKILADGSILLSTGSVELGQGVRTALSQVVAQELSLPSEMVKVAELDTQYTPYDQATNASSATAIMGQAVQKAARDAREQLISAASFVLKTDKAEIVLAKGSIIYQEKNWSFSEIMRRYFSNGGAEIVGRGTFQFPRDENAPIGSRTPFWEIGIGAAEVEVDESTGEIRILKYISFTDAGKVINPLQCRGQDEGAVLMGIGQTLLEELVYQDGRLANPNLMDYRVPKFRDLPESFSTHLLEEGGGPGPYGAKGLAEGGILAVAPAVCNALYNAAGIRIQEVPLRGERVWRVVRGKLS